MWKFAAEGRMVGIRLALPARSNQTRIAGDPTEPAGTSSGKCDAFCSPFFVSFVAGSAINIPNKHVKHGNTRILLLIWAQFWTVPEKVLFSSLSATSEAPETTVFGGHVRCAAGCEVVCAEWRLPRATPRVHWGLAATFAGAADRFTAGLKSFVAVLIEALVTEATELLEICIRDWARVVAVFLSLISLKRFEKCFERYWNPKIALKQPVTALVLPRRPICLQKRSQEHDTWRQKWTKFRPSCLAIREQYAFNLYEKAQRSQNVVLVADFWNRMLRFQFYRTSTWGDSFALKRNRFIEESALHVHKLQKFLALWIAKSFLVWLLSPILSVQKNEKKFVKRHWNCLELIKT